MLLPLMDIGIKALAPFVLNLTLNTNESMNLRI
jgi:hypothetical protein